MHIRNNKKDVIGETFIAHNFAIYKTLSVQSRTTPQDVYTIALAIILRLNFSSYFLPFTTSSNSEIT